MARFDTTADLTQQYVTLSQTQPRRMVEATEAPKVADPAQPEAEWSLRRIEARIGSIA